MNNRYRAELLPNNLIRVYDYKCQWAGLYNEDGSFHSGQCDNLKKEQVLALMEEYKKSVCCSCGHHTNSCICSF
jgi:hypothetical protein